MASPGLDISGLMPLTATTDTPDPRAVYQHLRERWGVVAPVELESGVNAWLVMGWPGSAS